MPAMPWMQVKDSASTGAGATAYAPVGNTGMNHNATEALRQRAMLVGGAWSGAWVRVTANDRTSGSALVSRIGAADGNQLLSIGAGVTGAFSTANSDTVASGNAINWKWTFGTGGTSFVYRGVNSLYTPSSGVLMGWYTTDGQNVSLNNVTRFHPLTGTMGGDDAINQTEAKVQYTARCDGTWKGLCFNVSVNAKGGNSFGRSRVDGVNGGQLVTIGGGVTGLVQDVTGSDAVVSGNKLNSSLTYFADGNTLRIQGGIASEFVASTTAPAVNCSGAEATANTQALSITNYYGGGIIGVAGNFPSTTEANVLTPVNISTTMSYLSVYVISNGLTGNTPFRIRKNSGNGASVVTAGSGVTGLLEDPSGSDSFAAADEFDFQVATPGAGTSIAFNSLAVLLNTSTGGPFPFYIDELSGGLMSLGVGSL